eukprot:gene21849-27920_t
MGWAVGSLFGSGLFNLPHKRVPLSTNGPPVADRVHGLPNFFVTVAPPSMDNLLAVRLSKRSFADPTGSEVFSSVKAMATNPDNDDVFDMKFNVPSYSERQQATVDDPCASSLMFRRLIEVPNGAIDDTKNNSLVNDTFTCTCHKKYSDIKWKPSTIDMTPVDYLHEVTASNVNKHMHCPTCTKGNIGNTQCRLGQPSPLFDFPTGPTEIVPNLHDDGYHMLADIISGEPILSAPKEWIRDFANLTVEEVDACPLKPIDQRYIVWEMHRPTLNSLSEADLNALQTNWMDSFDKLTVDNTEHVDNVEKLIDKVKEMSRRMRNQNGYVVMHNKYVMVATGCNQASYYIGSLEDAKTKIFYMAKYITKDLKFDNKLTNVMPLIHDARAQITKYPSLAEDTGTSQRTAMHLISRFVNNLTAKEEMPAAQVGLLLHNFSLTMQSHMGWFVFVKPAIRFVKEAMYLVADDTNNSTTSSHSDDEWNDDNEEDDADPNGNEDIDGRQGDRHEKPAAECSLDESDDENHDDTVINPSVRDTRGNDYVKSKQRNAVYQIGDKLVPISQEYHYSLRGESLRNMNLWEYACIIALVPVRNSSKKNKSTLSLFDSECEEGDDDDDNDSQDGETVKTTISDLGNEPSSHKGRLANGVHKLDPTHLLYKTHIQKQRSKLMMPIIAGCGIPPYPEEVPYADRDRSWYRQADRYGLFITASKWRDKSKCLTFDDPPSDDDEAERQHVSIYGYDNDGEAYQPAQLEDMMKSIQHDQDIQNVDSALAPTDEASIKKDKYLADTASQFDQYFGNVPEYKLNSSIPEPLHTGSSTDFVQVLSSAVDPLEVSALKLKAVNKAIRTKDAVDLPPPADAECHTQNQQHKQYIGKMKRLIEARELQAAFDLFIAPKDHETSQVDKDLRQKAAKVSAQQKDFMFHMMLTFVESSVHEPPRLVFVHGGAGTGKTFAICLLELMCRDFDKIVSFCAPTGQAAALLPGATTTFKNVESNPGDLTKSNSGNHRLLPQTVLDEKRADKSDLVHILIVDEDSTTEHVHNITRSDDPNYDTYSQPDYLFVSGKVYDILEPEFVLIELINTPNMSVPWSERWLREHNVNPNFETDNRVIIPVNDRDSDNILLAPGNKLGVMRIADTFVSLSRVTNSRNVRIAPLFNYYSLDYLKRLKYSEYIFKWLEGFGDRGRAGLLDWDEDRIQMSDHPLVLRKKAQATSSDSRATISHTGHAHAEPDERTKEINPGKRCTVTTEQLWTLYPKNWMGGFAMDCYMAMLESR